MKRSEVVGVMGAYSEDAVSFCIKGLMDQGLVAGSLFASGDSALLLTFTGWRRYEELREGAPSGRKAFMAMEFGHPELDTVLNLHFRPATEATGFRLERLDDVPKAGLIDDRLRVAIKAARFLIVDLSHDNQGAYWEAGYGEGLGKPVIYTCEESKFEEKRTHFDTNHHLTVLWKGENPASACEVLKATIRATIPEASRSDMVARDGS